MSTTRQQQYHIYIYIYIHPSRPSCSAQGDHLGGQVWHTLALLQILQGLLSSSRANFEATTSVGNKKTAKKKWAQRCELSELLSLSFWAHFERLLELPVPLETHGSTALKWPKNTEMCGASGINGHHKNKDLKKNGVSFSWKFNCLLEN